jgi:hypothetical protein
MTPLCELALKYRTDKCPSLGLNYTPFYWSVLKDKRYAVKKVLEVGIGCHNSMDRCVDNYTTGASLLMWRDFFPNAQIYGADIDPTAMFKSERIKTILCDSTKEKDIANVLKQTGTDIDVFIDDGTHFLADQLFLCRQVMPHLPKGVFYSIEDVCYPRRLVGNLTEYECYVPPINTNHAYRNNLVIVNKK